MRVIPRTAAAVLLTGLLVAGAAEAHGPCNCSFPQVGASGAAVTTRSPAYRVIFNPRPRDYGGAMREAGYASAHQPAAPTPTVLSRSLDAPVRRARFRVPEVPPGVYLVLIFDGSEGGSHSTWDYFHVLGPAPSAPVGVFASAIFGRPALGAGDWATAVDPARGYELGLPPGWQLSPESLTPHLTDPRELLSAGTFPLRFREGRCNHMPTGALRAMGPADGFVTILERGLDPHASWSEFASRPARFAEAAEPRRGDVSDCLGGGLDPVEYWMPFTDAGRHLYAMVVLGAHAPAQVRTEAFAVLDGLRLDPAVQPDWSASP